MPKRRTKLARARDLAEITHLRLQGESQAKIARALGLSQSQVSRSLAKLNTQWLNEEGVDLRLERARDLNTLEMVWAELWEAWHLSKKPKEVVRTVRRVGSNPYSATSVRTQKRVGTAAILHLALRARAQRSELFGLYASRDPHTDWREERARELREQGHPLDSLPLEVVLWELDRRYGVIEVWHWGPKPPTPEQLPPGFRAPLYPGPPPGFIPDREGGENPWADEEPNQNGAWT